MASDERNRIPAGRTSLARTSAKGNPASGTGDAPVGRRGFLGALAGLSAGAALAAPVTIGVARAETTEEERKKARYTESEHVKRFYETNRY